MQRFFNLDGPVFTFLGRVADLLILNILFLLTSLPIITIGASLTALSYATLKMHGEEEGYAWKNYLKSFKQNFKQGTVIWLIMLVAAILLFFDYRICASNSSAAFAVVKYVTMLGAFLWLMIFNYVFPMLSRFENTVATTITNALLLAISNLPRTFLMFLVTGGLIALTLVNAHTAAFGLLLWLMFGAAFVSWFNTMLISKIFEKLIPEDADAQTQEESELIWGEPVADDTVSDDTVPEVPARPWENN